MKTICYGVDCAGNRLTDELDYDTMIKWAFFSTSEYRLTSIKTDYDNAMPSNRIMAFTFQRLKE